MRIFSVAVLLTVGFALTASAQIDGDPFARDLMAKYGPPTPNGTFQVRPSLEMTVDFAENGHVCKIQLPAVAPWAEPGNENVQTRELIEKVILELVPLSVRVGGAKKFHWEFGGSSLTILSFDNVNSGIFR